MFLRKYPMRKKGLLLPFGREVTSSRFHRKSLDLAEISDTFICKPDKEQIEQILLPLGENLQKLHSRIQN